MKLNKDHQQGKYDDIKKVQSNADLNNNKNTSSKQGRGTFPSSD